jgi:uncharacterized protein (DUF305 family)
MGRLAATLLAALALFVAACGGDDGTNAPTPVEPPASAPGPGAGASGIEAHFVTQMIPHHESAVEMGRLAVDRAEHEELRELGRTIVETQTTEIRELRALADELGPARGPMPRGMGMSMGDDVEGLRRARPFDRAFIDQMVPHHEMAVRMSQMVRRTARDPRVRDLAERIIVAQEREIDQMNEWREDWYGAPAPRGGMGGQGMPGMGPDRGMGPPGAPEQR